MDITPFLSQLYPDGSHGGQCAVWAEKVMDFGPIGDSLAEKEMYVKLNGIIAANIQEVGMGFRIGDILVTTENVTNGHVAIVINIDQNNLYLAESNYYDKSRPEQVTYGRTLPKDSPQIFGIIRVPFKFDLGQCEININVLINHQEPWNLKVLDNIQNLVLSWTNNKLKFNFYPLRTDLQNWWYEVHPNPFDGMFYKVIAKACFDEVLKPYSFTNDNKPADVIAFIVNPVQWEGAAFGRQNLNELGYTYSATRPAQIQLSCAEHDLSPWYPSMPTITHGLVHEMSHFLHFLNGWNDSTHQFDNSIALNLSKVYSDLEFNRIKANL